MTGDDWRGTHPPAATKKNYCLVGLTENQACSYMCMGVCISMSLQACVPEHLGFPLSMGDTIDSCNKSCVRIILPFFNVGCLFKKLATLGWVWKMHRPRVLSALTESCQSAVINCEYRCWVIKLALVYLLRQLQNIVNIHRWITLTWLVHPRIRNVHD